MENTYEDVLKASIRETDPTLESKVADVAQQCLYGGEARQLGFGEFPTYRQVICAYYFLSKEVSDNCKTKCEALTKQIQDIWLFLESKMPQKSFEYIYKMVSATMYRVNQLNGNKTKVFKGKGKRNKEYMDENLDKIVDIAACRCELPVVNCNHFDIKCTDVPCGKIHIHCTCKEKSKMPDESRAYMKLMRERHMDKKNKDVPYSDKFIRRNLKHKVAEKFGLHDQLNEVKSHLNHTRFSRFISEMVKHGVSCHVASLIGNALLLDLNDANPIKDLDNIMLDGSELYRAASGVVVKNMEISDIVSLNPTIEPTPEVQFKDEPSEIETEESAGKCAESPIFEETVRIKKEPDTESDPTEEFRLYDCLTRRDEDPVQKVSDFPSNSPKIDENVSIKPEPMLELDIGEDFCLFNNTSMKNADFESVEIQMKRKNKDTNTKKSHKKRK